LQRGEKDIKVQLLSRDEVLTVGAVAERGSDASGGAVDLASVKLRNTDYGRFPTGGRGGVDDLINLPHLHEPAILDVLDLRYANDCICEHRDADAARC